MAIIGGFPTIIKNGDTEDATVVMSLLSFIQSQINSNACPVTTGSSILKGDGAGGTTAAVVGTDYASSVSVQTQYGVWCGTAGGTASAITLTPAPAITGYVPGQAFEFIAASASVGATTINVSGQGAKAATFLGTNPTVANSFLAGATYRATYDGTQFQIACIGAVTTVNAQTIAGVKTFTSPPVVPTPSGTTDATNKAYVDARVPAGAVLPFAMNAAPTGWLECDGSAVSRTTYATLFSAIGTTFGTGDGSTTFNIPDLRGQFVRGWAHSGSTDSGRTFGSGQAHAVQDHVHTFGFALSSPPGVPGGSGASAYNAGNTANMASGNAASETRPVNVALMYCIRT